MRGRDKVNAGIALVPTLELRLFKTPTGRSPRRKLSLVVERPARMDSLWPSE